MPTIIKTPDENDTPVSFPVPKNLAPYLRDLYAIQKREGESLDDWICRFVSEAGVRHVLQQSLVTMRTDASDQDATDTATLNQEYADLVNP